MQPSKLVLGMSPRLASANSGQNEADGPLGGDDNLMNSSCKDTMRMNDRREFSFFEAVNREFGNANIGSIYHGSLGQSRQANHFESINIGQVNDTVARMHGLNTSEIKREVGALYGANGASCNPFISDSYLFLNSNSNETYNFGMGSYELAPQGGTPSNYVQNHLNISLAAGAPKRPVSNGTGHSAPTTKHVEVPIQVQCGENSGHRQSAEDSRGEANVTESSENSGSPNSKHRPNEQAVTHTMESKRKASVLADAETGSKFRASVKVQSDKKKNGLSGIVPVQSGQNGMSKSVSQRNFNNLKDQQEGDRVHQVLEG